MAEEKPYIGSEQRPEVTIDLDKNICELTLRELRRAVFEISPGGIGDIKLAQESTRKNANKDKSDKESADQKSQNDFKVSTDKQQKDGNDSNVAPGLVLANDRSILELLRRLLASNEVPATNQD